MARKGRKQKQSKGLLYLIILICIVCICYEPIAGALHINLPAAVTELSEKTPVKATSTEAISIKNVLYPAPLKNTPEQILYRKGYTVSYNKETKIPNWVAWELTPEKLIERESRTEQYRNSITNNLKVDKNVTMGVVTDIKQALRQAYALKINYSARDRE